MSPNQTKFPSCKPAIFLTLLICLIYSNTLNCEWFLDDYHNITENPQVQMDSFNLKAIKSSFYATPTDHRLYRPLAYFTFALNWYWGQDDVTGYHVVNIAIHVLTAFILFLIILLLFQSPNLKGLDPASIYFVALLSSILWAIHPIQIQAVTYIVQRMASMATMFYILGIFCFLKARLTQSTLRKFLLAALCGAAFLLAVGSKNNALMLPVFLLLIEFVFFRDLSRKKTQNQAATIVFIGAMLVAAAGIFLFMGGSLGTIFNGYEQRPFTLYERLLTEPRIVLFYLSQIFYPIASRFSITHDIVTSTSLFTPWTTFPSLAVIFLLIGFALWRIKKNPVLAFAILFFLGNHIIESSIIPLELIFEHRNYLPSLFLFLPVSIGIKKALDHYRYHQKPMFQIIVASVCMIVTALGMSTYVRNWDWRSAKSLWGDAMKKAPESARPIHNLAWGYYESTGQIDKAVGLYLSALNHKFEKREYRADPYNNLAGIYYSRLHNYEKAAAYAEKATRISPWHYKSNLLLCNSLAMLGEYEEAMGHLNRLISQSPHNQKFLYLKGFILLKLSEPGKALEFFRRCLRLSSGNWRYLREIGLCHTHMGYYQRGYWFLKHADGMHPKQTGILLALADNRIHAGKLDEANMWAGRLVNTVGAMNAGSVIKKIAEDPLGIPFSHKKITSLISKNLEAHAREYSQTAEQLTGYFPSAK